MTLPLISERLLRSLQSTTTPKNREEEAEKAQARAAQRFGMVIVTHIWQ